MAVASPKPSIRTILNECRGPGLWQRHYVIDVVDVVDIVDVVDVVVASSAENDVTLSTSSYRSVLDDKVNDTDEDEIRTERTIR